MITNKKHIVIRQLGPHDVLLGRGTGPNEAIGNIRFRESIRVIIEHSDIRKLDGSARAELTTLIVARIKEIGGKFVKKVSLGSASETAKGPSLESVYEEVCDSVACAKVKQCIRHQLNRDVCSRAANNSSLTRPTTPHCQKNQARLPSAEANTTMASKPSCSPFQRPALSPAAILSGMLLHPVDFPNQQRHGQSGDRLCASLVDLLQHQWQSLPETRSANANSQPEPWVVKGHLGTNLFRPQGLRDHVPSTTGSAMAPTPQIATNYDKEIVVQLLKNQEQKLAFLWDALIVRRSKETLLKEQNLHHATDPQFLSLPLDMLEASVQEMGAHRNKCHRCSLAALPFF
jgi:hypothetical protein